MRVLAALLLLTACSTGSPAPTPAPERLPESMAALGDSITQAFLVCNLPANCPASSWSTGTDVDSHARRLERLTGRPLAVHNAAVSGARVDGLPAQARAAVAAKPKPEYVTVLIGANDACRPSADAMTPVETFAASFERALDTLATGAPDVKIFVASIPDLGRLRSLGEDRPEVRATWERFGICRSALAPNAPGERVRDRVREYNTVMANLCAGHPHCEWDGEAVFRYEFTLDEVSPLDYWHPGAKGQETLADVTWKAGFWADMD